MGVLKNLLAGKKSDSCCNVKIEEIKPQSDSNKLPIVKENDGGDQGEH